VTDSTQSAQTRTKAIKSVALHAGERNYNTHIFRRNMEAIELDHEQLDPSSL